MTCLSFRNKRKRIDGSEEDGSYGRLLNDDHKSKKDPEKITTDKNFLPFTSDTLCELLTEKKPVLIFSGLTDDEQKSVKELKDFGLVEDIILKLIHRASSVIIT
ncbi:hypothetical protein KUTeg_010056 [Tegillarca granosa]|uniref:Uncharacterized protein n=1 Tax=Tegillarca granosa TaxID=220873 RepID=A0ABQ9F5N0_TEGGR|nr:hypothetical protein KUTeg_010056 [Tegillarca granosa]